MSERFDVFERSVRRASRRGVRGATAVEYMIIVGVVVLAAIAGFQAFGKDTQELSKKQGQCVQAMSCSGGGNFPAASVDSNAGGGGGGAAQEPSWYERAASGAWNGVVTHLNNTVSFGKGVIVDGAWGTIKGTAALGYNLVTSPVQTTKAIASGIKHAVQNPRETLGAIKDDFVRAWNEDPARALGNGVFQIASTVVPVTKAAAVGKVAGLADKAEGIVGMARHGERLGDGAFSVGYRHGDVVQKVLKDEIKKNGPDSPPYVLNPGEKKWLAETTEEFHNEISKALGPDVVPPVKNLGDGVLEQKYVEGVSLDELRKSDFAAFERAAQQKEAAMHSAHKALDLDYGGSGTFENGWTLKIDDNEANFRFSKDGTLTSWFDPVAIFPP